MPSNYRTPESLEAKLAGRRGYQAAADAHQLGLVPFRLLGDRCLSGEGQAYVKALRTTHVALTEGPLWPPVEDEEFKDAVVFAVNTALSSVVGGNRYNGELHTVLADANRALGDLLQYDVMARMAMAEEMSQEVILG